MKNSTYVIPNAPSYAQKCFSDKKSPITKAADHQSKTLATKSCEKDSQ
jgi:hypothetical protein